MLGFSPLASATLASTGDATVPAVIAPVTGVQALGQMNFDPSAAQAFMDPYQQAVTQEALKEIDKKIPDVAILDVKLDKGDNDGIQLLSHIKSKNSDVPVIMISGHANIEMAVKSLQHGAFEFIEKPFDQERLINFVKRAVENFNLKKQNRAN